MSKPSSVIVLIASLVAVSFTLGCAARSNSARLSPAEATRIADAKIREVYELDGLQDYDRSAPLYNPVDDLWSIKYDRKRNVGPGDCVVEVYGKTKRAEVLVSDPAFVR